jgi:hypothetical protein
MLEAAIPFHFLPEENDGRMRIGVVLVGESEPRIEHSPDGVGGRPPAYSRLGFPQWGVQEVRSSAGRVRMKRWLVCWLFLVGLAVAGCEQEQQSERRDVRLSDARPQVEVTVRQ